MFTCTYQLCIVHYHNPYTMRTQDGLSTLCSYYISGIPLHNHGYQDVVKIALPRTLLTLLLGSLQDFVDARKRSHFVASHFLALLPETKLHAPKYAEKGCSTMYRHTARRLHCNTT